MRKNERGFTYPLTLAVVILFLLVFAFRVEQLLIERKLSHETATILQEDYYFHSTIKKIEAALQSGAVSSGTYSYQYGKMDYQAEAPIGTSQKITFTLKMHTGETTIGRGFFDTSTKKLTKWSEMN